MESLAAELPQLSNPFQTDDPLGAAAQSLFGVSYLFPYQRLVIANLLDAATAVGLRYVFPDGIAFPASNSDEAITRELADLGNQIVILPTGAGKSLCFQLPALLFARPTLVLYPILSLMADQYRRMSERGLKPALLRGGQDKRERSLTWNRLETGDCPIAIANPEVLLTEKTLKRIESCHFSHIVIDEAHCVCEWGESFRPAYLRLAEIVSAAKAPLVTAFTATASPSVLEKLRRYIFGTASTRTLIGDPDRPNIAYSAAGTILKDRSVIELTRNKAKPAIVFCSSRARTEALARELHRTLSNIDIWFYHAGLTRDEKDFVEKSFLNSENGVLVATCAYGMGVDKQNIRTVIHRDCPGGVEAYLQESGRAGRDGEPAEALLLWGPDDYRRLAALSDNTEDYQRYKTLLSYAEDTRHCRRETLLKLLGAESAWCSGCDVCRGLASGGLREEAAFIDFIKRNRRRYTIKEASRVIAGEYGGDWDEDESGRVLNYLLKRNTISLSSFPWRGLLTLHSENDKKTSLMSRTGTLKPRAFRGGR